MPSDTEPRTDEDESSSERPRFERRPLLKALGVGATLPVGIAGATARETTPQSDDARIDPLWGYAATDAGDIPADLQPDHEVAMRAVPPNPQSGRPPFLIFDPVGLHVDAGDVVQFTAVTPDHTVTAIHSEIFGNGRVPEGVPPFSSPILGAGGAWLYRFEQPGVYDLYCGPHQLLGMVMRLQVGDLTEADVPDYARTVEGLPSREQLSGFLNQMSQQNENCEWPFLLPASVLGADSLAPMTIQEMGAVPFGAVARDLGYEMPSDSEGGGGTETGGTTTVGNVTTTTTETDG